MQNRIVQEKPDMAGEKNGKGYKPRPGTKQYKILQAALKLGGQASGREVAKQLGMDTPDGVNRVTTTISMLRRLGALPNRLHPGETAMDVEMETLRDATVLFAQLKSTQSVLRVLEYLRNRFVYEKEGGVKP